VSALVYAVKPKHRRKPTKRELELLEMIGAGTGATAAAEELGLTYWAMKSRLAKLREVTGLNGLNELVYWGLTEGHIYYKPQGLTCTLTPRHIEVVEGLTVAKGIHQMAKEFHVTPFGIERRIRVAREKTGAKTQPHLIAICYTEDWIS